MTVVLDHTIVLVNDREESVDFYSRIFGFEDLGEVGPFLAVRVNDSLNLDFRQSDDFRSIHYAFAMEAGEFEAAFQRIKDSNIPYGDSPVPRTTCRGRASQRDPRATARRFTSKTPAATS